MRLADEAMIGETDRAKRGPARKAQYRIGAVAGPVVWFDMVRADTGVVGGRQAEMTRDLAQISVLGGAQPTIGERNMEQPVKQVFKNDGIPGKQPTKLAGIACKPVRALAGEIKNHPDMVFLTRRDLKDVVKRGHFVAGHGAVNPRHLGAERDRCNREGDPPLRVTCGRIGAIALPVREVVGDPVEQCAKGTAKGQLDGTGNDASEKAHTVRKFHSRYELPTRRAPNLVGGDWTLLCYIAAPAFRRGLILPRPLAAREPGVDRVDVIVIGGGLVGAAIAYGLVRTGLATAMLDEGDVAFRASRGNFGLVWVQSKGEGAPHYQRWTRRSAEEWPGLAAELAQKTGICVGYRRPGGLHLCLDEREFDERRRRMERMRDEAGNLGFDYRMIDHDQAAALLPGLGPTVVGASWTPYDGHANPLNLLRALHQGFVENGGRYIPNTTVVDAAAAPADFRVAIAGGAVAAPKVVLAAGLGNCALASLFGLSAPVRPQRGQILVTERAQPLLPMPTTTVRQTEEGTIMLGDSMEEVGFDTGQTPAVMQMIARRAVLAFPWLRPLQIVRAWACLRVMPPDGLPIYDQSQRLPGAFTANCHSGVTLAGAHANLLAPMIAAGALDPSLNRFSAKRFDVPAAA
jgi:glycine/D-amino acid oxidase-like deaminating enzyme